MEKFLNRWFVPILGVAMAAWLGGCTPSEADDDTTGDDDDTTLDEIELGDLEEWASPIEDQVALWEAELGVFGAKKGIWDLGSFEDRLYFGYGDWTANTGKISPAEIRYFEGSDPGSVTTEFVTNDEAVESIRPAGDLLLIPGVDDIEEHATNTNGSAYVLQEGGDWLQTRTLEAAWHVFDMARAGDALYASATGGYEQDYYDNVSHGYLYQSDDQGESYQRIEEFPHPDPPGWVRPTKLLGVGDQLLLFGYVVDTSYGVLELPAHRLVNGQLETVVELADTQMVEHTVSLSEDVGLISSCVEPFFECSDYTNYRATSDGLDVWTALDGLQVIDAYPLGDGRVIVVARDEADLPAVGDSGPFLVGLLSVDGSEWTELLAEDMTIAPQSIAFWQEAVYLGMSNGTVWRAGILQE